MLFGTTCSHSSWRRPCRGGVGTLFFALYCAETAGQKHAHRSTCWRRAVRVCGYMPADAHDACDGFLLFLHPRDYSGSYVYMRG